MKNTSKIITFFVLFLTGCMFAGWGMMTPPPGVIDGSVLIFIGQVFILAASIYGVECHFNIKEGQFSAGKKEEDDETN